MKHLTASFLFVFIVFWGNLSAQNSIVEGRILKGKQPVANMQVHTSGKFAQKTVTNKKGHFRLKDVSPAIDSLFFVADSVEVLRIPLEGFDQITVQIQEDTTFIQRSDKEEKPQPEYGGTIITRQTLEETGVKNLLQAISAKTPGVEYTNGNLLIRSFQSFTNNNYPLYIIDGIQVWDASYLTVEDVEYVEVVKGSAAAQFGVKGTNGVIIIKRR